MEIAQLSKDKRKKQYAAAGSAYAKMLKPLSFKNVSLQSREQAKVQFLREYKEIIEAYMADAELKDDTINDSFKLLVNLYRQTYYKRGATKEGQEKIDQFADDRSGISAAVNTHLKDSKISVRELPTGDKEGSESNLTNAQKSGLKDISRWMLRNMDKTGLFGDSTSTYVRNFVLKQPARVKLCAYYLVETDARKKTGLELRDEMIKSQTYVPDLDKFKDKMIATKFKFWKRVMGSQVYWNKLSQAFHIAVAQQAQLMKFGNLGTSEVTEADGKENQTNNANSNTDSTAQRKAGRADLEKKLEAELMKRVANVVELLEKQKNFKGTEEEKKQLEKQLQTATNHFLWYGKLILKKVQEGDNDFFVDDGTGAKVESKLGIGKIVDSIAGNVVQQAGDTVISKGIGGATEGIADIANLFEEFDTGKAIQEVADKIKLAGDITGHVGGWVKDGTSIFLFATAITGIVRAAKKSAYTTKTEKLEQSLQILESFLKTGEIFVNRGANIAETVTAAMLTSAEAAGTATAEAVAATAATATTAATIIGGAASIVTGAAIYATGLGSVINSEVKMHRLSSGIKAIQERAENSTNEKDKEDAAKAQQLARLKTRIEEKKEMSSVIKMTGGYLQILGGILMIGGAFCPILAPIGTILSFGVLGGCAVDFIYSLIANKKNRNAAIDEYINMDKVYETVMDIIRKNIADRSKKKLPSPPPPDKNKLKDAIRLEAAAQMGCYNLDDFYNYITREYATFLYDKVMLKDDGTPVNDISEMTETNKDYAKLLKGLGLKPDYKKKRPTPITIQKRLRNK